MATRNPFLAGAPSDPVPWLTERFREYGVFEDDIDEVVYLSRVLGACQSTVNAMSDHNKTFVVKFAGEAATAYTNGKTQRIVVGTRNLLDPNLSEGQRAAITVAMAAHEVGHVRWSVNLLDRLGKHYTDPFASAWAAKVFNVIHDIHLEYWQQHDFPTLAPVFDLKGRYFARPWTFKATRNVERYGALINATLYPHATDWTASPEATAFKAWADDWGQRCTLKAARTLKGAVALIDEALAFLRYDEQSDIPEDETPAPTEPDEGEDEDEDEDEDGDPGEGDEDGDDRDGDKTESGDPGEDEADEDGDGTSNGGDWDGEDDDSDSDGTDPGEGDGQSGGPPESRESGDDGGEKSEAPATEADETTRRIGDEGPATKGDEEPLPTIHGDMHTLDDVRIQGEIDRYERVQAHSRDRFIVGGGDFHYREMRIVRIKR